MSFDPDSPSDRADMEDWKPRKCRCGGTGWVSYERGNPYAVEPCGCDEREDEEEEEEETEA